MDYSLITDGLTFRRNFFRDLGGCSEEMIHSLREKLINYELEQRSLKTRCGLDEGTFWGAHHFLRIDVLLERFISSSELINYLSEKFETPPILNSIGLSIVPPVGVGSTYLHGSNVHRDQRSFHDSKTPRNIWILVLLDDFTFENGATLFYGKSHTGDVLVKDSDSEIRALGKLGDCVIYDGRTYHRSMPNFTQRPRVAMTISFTPAYIKPQFDYLGLYQNFELKDMSRELLQMIGYFSRVPRSLSEWYAPPEKRFYRGDQG